MNLKEIHSYHRDKELNHLKETKRRLVHYTSASVLVSILKNKEIWLRKTTLMNDYDEIERGIREVDRYFGSASEKSKSFWSVLDECYPRISEEIRQEYIQYLFDLRNNTFVLSLSQHLDGEDKIGRLSMWRAYAPVNGIALVIKPDIIFREENELNMYAYPALYWDENTIKNKFSEIVDLFKKHKDKIALNSKEDIIWHVVEMLISYAICLKHPGFQEEREIRVVYRPNDIKSEAVQDEILTIGGVPQIIQKIPVNDKHGTAINQILDHVIVGPSQFGKEICNAVYEVMKSEGINDAESKIKLSDIPLRT